MSNKIPFAPIAPSVAWIWIVASLFSLLCCGNALGACPTTAPFSNYQDIDIRCTPQPGDATYATTAPTAINELIQLCPTPPVTTTNVNWVLGPGVGCSGTSSNITCGTMTIAAPPGSSPVASPVGLSGTTPPGVAIFTVTATDAANSSVTCERNYLFHVTSSGGGWGDPHLNTVDSVRYDFQSTGEFTGLRGDGLEIQTRQIPVATTFLPGANPYTGLATCVAIYTAVAARVGKHRVSYEPNISGVPDPTGLQLRVDGVLTTLGPGGVDLGPGGPPNESPTPGAAVERSIGGRIVKSPAGDGIEIHYSNGTTLVVTPAWWPDQQKWYLNVNVYGTAATQGTFGKLAKDSWLPALPDGTSLGPKPDSLHERYVSLYEKFADAWRVTKNTSLFDYAPGTSPDTFTVAGWPRENPSSCAIEGQPSAKPVGVDVAQQQCSAIVDKNIKSNCVFDVSVTGHTGFAQTYLLTQRLQPDVTETTVKGSKDPSKPGERVGFSASVAQRLSRGGTVPAGTVQFILDGRPVGKPIMLDAHGQALWTTSSLPVGRHQIVAKYSPTAWGSLFLASTSSAVSHTVGGDRDDDDRGE